jgi:hypothetical protein
MFFASVAPVYYRDGTESSPVFMLIMKQTTRLHGIFRALAMFHITEVKKIHAR